MTGYGEAEASTSRGKLSVQLKSLNSKNFELNFRANSSFQQFELDAKKQLLKKLKRGKIELFVVEDSTNIAAHKINRAVVAEYMKQLKSISAAPDEILFPLTLRMPDALKNLNKKTTSSQIKELKKLLDKSIDKLILYRINEGKSIEKYLRNKILNIEKKLNLIIDNGVIFVSDNIGFLYAFDYKNNKVIWAKNYKIPFRSNLKISQDKLLASNQNNNLYFEFHFFLAL